MGDIGTERREVEFEPLPQKPVRAPLRGPDPARTSPTQPDPAQPEPAPART